MRTLVISSLAFLFFAVPTHAQKLDADVETLVRGNSEFAADLYQRLAEKDGNLFFSPYSISNALAMTYAGARRNTAVEMKNTLHFNFEGEALHPAFGKLIRQLHAEGEGKPRPFQFAIANRLWGQKDYGFQPAFLKIGRDFYHAGLEELDFAASEDARKTINAWVEKQTKDKIKDLLKPGNVNANTRLVLTNAIYFKAPWMHPFPKETQPGTFHFADGKTVKTPIMHQQAQVGFASHDSFAIVELPYEGYEQSMVILLPKKHDGLPELEKKLTAENLAAWLKKLAPHEVDLKLPKFKVTSSFSLSEVLIQMGMKDAFTLGKADFSGLATRENLAITAVIHKAFVDVNEAGTEAAAATAVIIGTDSKPPTFPAATFHANRPFVFLIRDQRSGSILFQGRVANPT